MCCFLFLFFVCLFWVNLCFNGLPLYVFVLLCVCVRACMRVHMHACTHVSSVILPFSELFVMTYVTDDC